MNSTFHSPFKTVQNISKRKRRWLILFISILTISHFLMKPVDLKTSDVRQTGITKQKEQTGRAILDKMAMVHGIEAFQQQKTQTLYFTNTWKSLPGAVYRPWKANGQMIEMTCTVGEHLIAETKFLSGENTDEIWGYDQKGAYTKTHDLAKAVYTKNAAIELWLPSFQFLMDIPFRVAYLPFVADMGKDEIDGKLYLKVFATWFDIAPSNKHDQIVYWINAETYELEMLHYTCRGSGFGFFSATIHYQDYQKTDGILMPQKANITFGSPKTKVFGKYIDLHQIEMLDAP